MKGIATGQSQPEVNILRHQGVELPPKKKGRKKRKQSLHSNQSQAQQLHGSHQQMFMGPLQIVVTASNGHKQVSNMTKQSFRT